MDVQKFTSGDKTVIECRFNPVLAKHRVHIQVDKKRVGPVYIAAGAEEAEEAARQALTRAVERGLIYDSDFEADEEGAPFVHAEGAKGKAPSAKQAAPIAKGKAPAAKDAAPIVKAPKAKRPAPPMGEEGAHKIIGNGHETRALEDTYLEAKDTYHEVGEALKERHHAVATLAAQPA